MTDQIIKYAGISLPEGMEFDGRHARICPPIRGRGVGNWICRVDQDFKDFGGTVVVPADLPVIVVGDQLGYFGGWSVCLSPIGLISVSKERLIFEDAME